MREIVTRPRYCSLRIGNKGLRVQVVDQPTEFFSTDSAHSHLVCMMTLFRVPNMRLTVQVS